MHPAPGGLRYESLCGPRIEKMDLGTESHPHAFLTDISLADTQATVEAGLTMQERGAQLNNTDGAPADRLPAPVDQRIALLPVGGTVHHFVASGENGAANQRARFLAGLPVPRCNDAERVAEDICRFASEWCDGDPLRRLVKVG